MAGGYGSGRSELSSIEEGDPTTGTWKKVGDLPTRRGDVACATVNGLLYVAGGYFDPTGITNGAPAASGTGSGPGPGSGSGSGSGSESSVHACQQFTPGVCHVRGWIVVTLTTGVILLCLFLSPSSTQAISRCQGWGHTWCCAHVARMCRCHACAPAAGQSWLGTESL